MKRYMHPASTICRPVMLFVAEIELPVEQSHWADVNATFNGFVAAMKEQSFVALS